MLQPHPSDEEEQEEAMEHSLREEWEVVIEKGHMSLAEGRDTIHSILSTAQQEKLTVEQIEECVLEREASALLLLQVIYIHSWQCAVRIQ